MRIGCTVACWFVVLSLLDSGCSGNEDDELRGLARDSGGDIDGSMALPDSGTLPVAPAPDAAQPLIPCGSDLCDPSERCAHDHCVPRVACSSDDGCSDDSYCDTEGWCLPWKFPDGARSSNESCLREPDLAPFQVELECAFTTPPANALPTSNQVMATPSVADLNLDGNTATVGPSLVFATFAGQVWPDALAGNLRIIDGRTCAHQQSLTSAEDRVISTATPALVDLDNDGRIEILMPRASAYGGVIAFAQDENGVYARRWVSAVCDGQGGRDEDGVGAGIAQMSPGLSVHDLDDDGVPEVIYGAVVYDAQGCVRDDAFGLVDYVFGHIPVAADLDGDGLVELSTGDLLLEWVNGAFALKASFEGDHERGPTAVADFGDFGEGPGVADIAHIANGTASIETVQGRVVFGPITLSSLNLGGPPTVADFDGDGALEFAAAGSTGYTVFDPECDVDPVPSECAARGVRWTQPSQDATSSVTGSSVFDFEGDGAAEAVYADECFLRVYDGASGTVKFSVARSSGTAYEYPLIADVDGDFHTELVVDADEWPISCGDADPLLPSSTFAILHGLFVYGSVRDDWAGSRPLWNQHAYNVTNVDDQGRVARTSAWPANWKQPSLNNFRQNVQGKVPALAAVDLTVTCEQSACTPSVLACDVCNRGAQGVDLGVRVAFRSDSEDSPFCTTETDVPLLPGACDPVTCEWHDSSHLVRSHILVSVDSDDTVSECFEANNGSAIEKRECPTP